VIELEFGAEDVGRIRFAIAPLWEAVMSVRALAATGGLHAPWARQVRPRLDVTDLELLTALIRPEGYIPDFLVPPPARRVPSIESSLAQVANTDAETVAAQLLHLSTHRVAQSGPGDRVRRAALLRGLIDAPQAGLARVVATLDRYWRLALAPFWPQMRALLQADVTYRLDQIASGGVTQLLRTLHPSLSFDGRMLRIVKYYDGYTQLGRRGLLLVPCAFAWPDVIVQTADPHPTVSYSPRGLGRLWEGSAMPVESALANVIGRTRATLLAQLDLPMSTTQLAVQLGLSAPTLSVHLKALQSAGIVTARRDGHAVLYSRTHLGELLLSGSV
jgi:DNA-binding transcriptional ArsR family regulator